MLEVPNEPFLRELFAEWQTQPNLIIIRDPRIGFNATLDTLLRDVVQAHKEIKDALPTETRSRLENSNQDVFVPLMATSGYRFVVLFLALFSIGAVAVPLSPTIYSEEAENFVILLDAAFILASKEHTIQAKEVSHLTSRLAIIPTESTYVSLEEPLRLADAQTIDLDRSTSLSYTSGSSGKHKGVLHTRRALYEHAKAEQQFFEFSPSDLFLVQGQMHWSGGFGMLLFALCSAMPMEISAAISDPEWFWRRIQKGDLTAIITSAGALKSLEAFFHANLGTWTQEEHEAIRAGLSNFRLFAAGSIAVPMTTKTFWTGMRGGKTLQTPYGSTEAMLIISCTRFPEDQIIPHACVGTPLPNIEIKTSKEGEILLKGPGIFSRYITDEAGATERVFTPDGFFKTGDVGEVKSDGNLYLYGRLSVDVIRYLGWLIYGPEVEDSLLQLVGISTAAVVPVSDEEAGERVGALICVDDRQSYDLKTIRNVLNTSHGVLLYKLPTLLRVVRSEDEIPKTSTGKLSKRHIIKSSFDRKHIDAGDVEVWDLNANQDELTPAKPFDWGGVH